MKIPQQVGENCATFGMSLLDDHDDIAIAEHDYRGDTERIVCCILQLWFQYSGNPAWHDIVRALRKCDLSSAADQIEMACKLLSVAVFLSFFFSVCVCLLVYYSISQHLTSPMSNCGINEHYIQCNNKL